MSEKTTISVPEMQRMLGLKKTDAYWLVHKNCFETILVTGRMRIVKESFEKWYANQVKHRKVDGTPPGDELRAYSYSIPEIAEVLGISDSVAYDLVKRCHIETFEVDSWKRVRKDVFESWYQSQRRYRTMEDRKRDEEAENSSMTMPEMAKLLLIGRKEVYSILDYAPGHELFEFVTIAERRHVTKKSFERWYTRQSKYRKLCYRSPEEQADIARLNREAEIPRLKVDENKSAFTLQEAAILLDLNYNEIRELLRDGELESKKYGTRYLILRDEIQWFLLQQKLGRKSDEGSDG